MNTRGYIPGGMTAKYFNTGATTMANAANYGVAPGSVIERVQPNDSLFRQAPAGVNSGGLANTLALYQGLLTVTTGGTYYFGGGSDDQMQIVVDAPDVELVTARAVGGIQLGLGFEPIYKTQFSVTGQ